MLSNFNAELLQQLTKAYNLQYNIRETRRVLDQKFVGIDASPRYGEVLTLMWEVMQGYFGAQYNLINEYKQG